MKVAFMLEFYPRFLWRGTCICEGLCV